MPQHGGLHSSSMPVNTHTYLGVEPMRTLTVVATDTFAKWLEYTQEEVKATLECVVDDMKMYYDQNHQSVPEYKVGDKCD